jgi:hypothetical protein
MPAPPSAALDASGGVPVAQPTIDGRRLDDVVGPRWLLVTDRPRFVADDPTRLAVLDAAAHPELVAVLGDDDLVLVRPDRYVCVRGSASGGIENAVNVAPSWRPSDA